MTVIIDYGVGNLFSLKSSFAAVGENAVVSSDYSTIKNADRLVLPGVGAFSDAADKLNKSGVKELLVERAQAGVPILGICLGMQLLFEKSYEYGIFDGTGLLKGEVVPIPEKALLKIPHMGWNALDIIKPHPLFKYVKSGEYVYFVHSYHAIGCDESVIATAEYGTPITAAVACKNIMGCQFHPEKSGETGLKILKSFCELIKEQL